MSLFKPPLVSPSPPSSLRPAHPPAAAGHEPAAPLLATSRTSRATSVPAAALPSPAHCLSHAADLLWAQDDSSDDHMLRTQSNPLKGSAGGAGPVIRDSADLEKFWCAHHLLLQFKHRREGCAVPCMPGSIDGTAYCNSAPRAVPTSQAACHMRKCNASPAEDTLVGCHTACGQGPCYPLAKKPAACFQELQNKGCACSAWMRTLH